jgi:hypothetical protein
MTEGVRVTLSPFTTEDIKTTPSKVPFKLDGSKLVWAFDFVGFVQLTFLERFNPETVHPSLQFSLIKPRVAEDLLDLFVFEH